MIEHNRDLLTDKGSISGILLLNFGDPAYDGTADLTPGLGRAESVFLRIISYLVFAEAVSVPTRFILDGADMAQALAWSTPLLEAGILIPERRVGPSSFDELAQFRNLPEIGRHRAEFLDRHASRVRVFHYRELSTAYIDLLTHDLSEGGAFRRVVRGGQRGQNSSLLSTARDNFVAHSDGTPEAFVNSVRGANPALVNDAWRWAMARYYTTPLLFDESNTREIPASAAKLLTRAGVLDSDSPRFESAAPVDESYARLGRLHTSLPAGSIGAYHREYCESLLEVRRAVPEARRIFSDIRDAAQLKDAGDSLSRRFADELARQKRERPGPGNLFLLMSSLAGGGAGFAGGLLAGTDVAFQVATALSTAVAAGYVTDRVGTVVKGKRGNSKQPWLLAMDRIEAGLPNPARHRA